MKIPVLDYPERPCECLFARWNCEYGWICSFKSNDGKYYCKDTSECEYLEKTWRS